jgi:hypothetical protein
MVADDPESFADLDGHVMAGSAGQDEICTDASGCNHKTQQNETAQNGNQAQQAANTTTYAVSASSNNGPTASASITTSPDGVQLNAKAALHDEKSPGGSGFDPGRLQIGAADASAQASLKNKSISSEVNVSGVAFNLNTSGGPTKGTVNIAAVNGSANASVSTKGVSAGAEASFVKFGSTLSVKFGGTTVTLFSQVNVVGAGAKFNADFGKGHASGGIGGTWGLGANLKVDVKW